MRRLACAPANTIQDATPLEGQGAHGCLGRLARGALRLVRDLGPAGMSGGFRRPLHKRLAQHLGTRETPVDPRVLPAAFRHGRHSRSFLEVLGRSGALSWCTKGPKATGGKDRTGAWPSRKQGEVGRLLGPLCNGVVEGGNALQGDAEWGHERLPEQGVGGMPPSSVVSVPALWMASRRGVMTSAECTW
jgi:hypothetical protein